MEEDRRVPDGTRLSSATEPASCLGPSGFDPSRMVRIPYGKHGSLRDTDALILRTRKGAERLLPSFKWWIDRNTPVGDDATLWERMRFQGRRSISWGDVLAVVRDSDRSGEAGETALAGSTEGESAGPQDIAQPGQSHDR